MRLENWTYLSVIQFINLYIKYNKFFCDLWIFLKKKWFFYTFFMPIFSASHHPVSLSKVSIATAAAQGGTYTKSPTFYILKYNKNNCGWSDLLKIKCTYFTPLNSIQKNWKGSVKQYPIYAKIASISIATNLIATSIATASPQWW